MNDTTEVTTAVPAAHPTQRRWWFRFVAFQLVAVCGILIGMEFLFAALGVQKADIVYEKPPSNYPANAQQYTKIAVFGGSAAAGTYAPRSFHDVLQFELQARFPDRPLYVKNYASHGEPFHGHQAEYAKRLVSKYDFVLIYCGNNEAENWYDNSGYWRKPEFRQSRDLVYSPPIDAMEWPWLHHARSWLGRYSRTYALASRIHDGMEAPVSKNLNRNYSEFESQPSVPPEEMTSLLDDFRDDIREIGSLAAKHGTQVLLASAATWETWPPSYSTFRAGLDEDTRAQWQQHYGQAEQAAKQQQWQQAIAFYLRAIELDDSVAILHHRLGLAYLQSGEVTLGRQHLQRSVDLEGHYFRPPQALHDMAAELAQELDHLHHVDVVAAFHQAMQQELVDEDLFTDLCHPSFLGYVVMAHAFLEKLLSIDPFASEGVEPAHNADWKQLAAQRYRDLKIDPEEHKVALAGNILYCFDLMHFSAYPERCLEQVRHLMERLEQLGQDDPMVQAFNAVCRARFAVRDFDLETALKEINRALDASPDDLDKILDLKAWDHYIEDEFTDVGIEYSREMRRFIVSGVSVLP